MPVINLPKDTRFAELGEGLGKLIGGAVEAYTAKQNESVVAEVLNDPGISELDKAKQIFKRGGRGALDLYKEHLGIDTIRAKLEALGAETTKTGAETAVLRAKLPTVGAQAEANVGLTQSQTTENVANAERMRLLMGPQAALTGAQAAETQERVPGTAAAQSATTQLNRQKSAGQALENQLVENQINRQNAFGAAAATGAIDTMFDKQLEPFKLTPQQKAIAVEEYKSEEGRKAGTGYSKMIDRATAFAAENNKVVAPTNPQQAFLDTTARQAASTRVFVNEFAKGGAQRMGLTEGAWPQVIAEKLGIPGVADPQLVQMYNSTLQQVQSAASNTGGFYSDGLRRMAKDVTAGVTTTPMHAIIATDQVADRVLAALEIRKKALEGTKVSLAPYDQLIDEWKGIKDITRTFKTDVVPDTRYKDAQQALANGRTVMFFNNAQVDSQFNPLLKNDNTEYTLRDGVKVTGAQLWEDAKARKMDPYQLYLSMGGKRR